MTTRRMAPKRLEEEGVNDLIHKGGLSPQIVQDTQGVQVPHKVMKSVLEVKVMRL